MTKTKTQSQGLEQILAGHKDRLFCWLVLMLSSVFGDTVQPNRATRGLDHLLPDGRKWSAFPYNVAVVVSVPPFPTLSWSAKLSMRSFIIIYLSAYLRLPQAFACPDISSSNSDYRKEMTISSDALYSTISLVFEWGSYRRTAGVYSLILKIPDPLCVKSQVESRTEHSYDYSSLLFRKLDTCANNLKYFSSV